MQAGQLGVVAGCGGGTERPLPRYVHGAATCAGDALHRSYDDSRHWPLLRIWRGPLCGWHLPLHLRGRVLVEVCGLDHAGVAAGSCVSTQASIPTDML